MGSITATGLGKSYAGTPVLSDINLEVKQGEFVTVLGPSGSGKSTLLSIIAGLETPSAGQILLGGQDITGVPANRRGMGLVFQSYALFPTMSVHDNVAFPLRVRRTPRAAVKDKVAWALGLVRMQAMAGRRISQLSGGQQQRVALARALVFDPTVLLLDEPLGALDRKLRQEVQVELRELQRRLGITTVMVTHDQEEALSLSDRIALVREGRLEQFGTPDELHARPRTAFVADFFGAGNIIEGTLHQHPDGAAVHAGDLQLPCLSERPDGSPVTAVLRPELIELGTGPGGTSGVVRESIYLGTSVRHHVRVGDGREVLVLSAGRAGTTAAGAQVRLTWRREDVWLLPPTTDTGTDVGDRVDDHTVSALSAPHLHAASASTVKEPQ